MASNKQLKSHASVVIPAAELTAFAAALLRAADVSEAEARCVAESLVASNLRGHESHGVMRVPEYVGQLRRVELVAGAELEPISQTDSLLAANAQRGFGQVQIVRLLERLVPMAHRQGVACGTMFNCGHVGRLGEWVERAARLGLAALLSVNDNGVLRCVAPPGGVEPRISTNPVALAVPTGTEPLVLDISTSIVANGKVTVARLAGKQCPPGWLQDAEGNPTTDPNVRIADPPGSLFPLDGPDGYKGFGLGLLLDVLVGGLSGGFCPPAPAEAPSTNNVLLVVWDPEQFAGKSHFFSEADKLIDYVRRGKRKPGIDAIRLPGDRSTELCRQRGRDGVPLDPGTWSALVELAGELRVALPGVS
jgi:uncharacterized oxidoreductase